jgi:hypothetical protein
MEAESRRNPIAELLGGGRIDGKVGAFGQKLSED